MSKSILSIAVLFLCANFVFSQSNPKPKVDLKKQNISSQLKSSAAFAEVLLKKTEIESELESLLVSYTDEFPKVQDIRFEMSVLNREIERLNAVKSNESAKLTSALGKLIVRKAELETDLWNLQKKFGDTHPEVVRAKRKSEIFEIAIREILE